MILRRVVFGLFMLSSWVGPAGLLRLFAIVQRV
jgi:hypothetical protein